MALSRAWLLLSVPGGLAALVGLVRVVGSLVRRMRRAVVATVPVPAPTTTAHVDLPDPGRFSLHLDTTRRALMQSSARKLRLGMATEGGVPVPTRPAYFRTQSSSFSRVRLEMARVDVSQAGRYRLWVELPGDATPLPPDAAIVVSRPTGGIIVGHVLLAILLGWGLIGGIVASALVLSGAEPQP